jgi:hypothetical protein
MPARHFLLVAALTAPAGMQAQQAVPDGAPNATRALPPKVICGMTVIPMTPDLDRGILVPTPPPPATQPFNGSGGYPVRPPAARRQPTPTIRTVQPSMCWDPAPPVAGMPPAPSR